MGDPLRNLKVVRYNQDGGYAPREWARAIEAAGISGGRKGDGGAGTAPEPVRVGVQITKTRAVDVVVRIERIDTLGARIRAALGRTDSDRLFRSKRGRARIGMARGLAVLSGTMGTDTVRVLVGAPLN